jgi:PilZ domain-containing protein
MADRRTIFAGQPVTLEVPSAVRALLPVAQFIITQIDDQGVHVEADDAFPSSLPVGTPVVVFAGRGQRPLEGLIAENLAPTKLILTLEALPERRQQIRAELAVDGELQLTDEPGAFPVRFTTIDISEGGLALKLFSNMARGQRAFITLDFVDEPVLAIGEILECSVPISGSYFEARIRFTSIAEGHRKRLARMLTKVSEPLDAAL